MTMSSLTQAERAGRTILVVDDEGGILDLVRQVLKHANYHVISSQSGDHAWGVIERGQPELNLVLTDIVMPGSMDGFILADNTRQQYPKLPVVFMTGALPESDDKAAEIARKKLLLRKPFSPKQLLQFVDSHIEESGAGSR